MFKERNRIESTHEVTRHGFEVSQHFPRQLTAILGLTRLLNSAKTIEERYLIILSELHRLLQAEHVTFHLIRGNPKRVVTYYLNDSGLSTRISDASDSLAMDVIRGGRIIRTNESLPTQLKGRIARYNETTVKSYLLVPICDRDTSVIGCIQAVNKLYGEFDQKDTNFMLILADLISMAKVQCELDTRAERCLELEREMRGAVEIQRRLLPSRVPNLPDYDVYAFNEPCQDVGGDYYDFFPAPRTTSFVLADVAGHGVPAALLSANLHAALHAHSIETDTCKEIVRKVNNHFHLYTSSDMFATMIMGRLNHDTHRLRFINAGHVPPLLIRKDKSVERLSSTGMPIGIVESFEHSEKEVYIAEGDTVIALSDGLLESKNAEGEQFGLARLTEIARENLHLPAKNLGFILLKEIREHAASQPVADDMTMLILKRKA